MADPKVVLDREDMRRTLTRIAHEIVENGGEPQRLALVGIHRRGAVLAARLRELLAALHGIDIPLGDLDIAFYRDDVTLRAGSPVVHATHLDFDVDGRTVVIVDDVLYTGRTVRPRSAGTFLMSRSETSAKAAARSRMRSMSARSRSSIDSRCLTGGSPPRAGRPPAR